MVPLLARVFTAIGSLSDLTHGFHEGLLTLLHKSGDRADPANYRPITLLNSGAAGPTIVLCPTVNQKSA
jgi:hypothetical protein